MKETPPQTRDEHHPVKIVAAGTVTPPPIENAPFPEAPTSWLAKHSSYKTDESRIEKVGALLKCLLPGSDGYATLDFGKPLHGYLCLEIGAAPAGAVLDFTYGEIRDDLRTGKRVLLPDGSFDPELTVGAPFGDRVIVRGGPQTIELPEERTWRWLMITWRNTKKPIELKAVFIRSSQHPAPDIGSFHADGVKTLPKLIDLCLDHARVTMSDAYVDTTGREDAQWLEDIQYRAQLAAQWFGDSTLRQVTMRHAVEQQLPTGRFRVFPPEDYAVAGMQSLDWSMTWIGMLYDDWMWTGETERLRKYFPNLVRFLELAHSQTNPDGLLVDRTCLTDIRCALRANHDAGEIESIPNAWYFGFLQNAIALAKAVGDAKQARQWQARAARVKREYARFISTDKSTRNLVGEVWSPTLGLRGFGQAASVSAVFYELIAKEDATRVLDSAFCGRDGTPPRGMNRWNNPTYAYRALRALGDLGRGPKASEHFLERYRPYLPDGPLPEYFIPGDGQPDDPTGSHGWAAVPLVWLHDTVLGVRLASPGGKRLIIAPAYVGWNKVSGKTATPQGGCEVQIDWAKRSIEISIPEGCSAEIRLPRRNGRHSDVVVWKNRRGLFRLATWS
jgi:hypothetical protein